MYVGCHCYIQHLVLLSVSPNNQIKGSGALLAKIEYDGIVRNLQGLMCKKRQITYRYFMFGWLKVKKSPGGLKKPHNNHGGKIWFSLVKNVNISRQLCSDWLKMWHSPWIFFVILNKNMYMYIYIVTYPLKNKFTGYVTFSTNQS